MGTNDASRPYGDGVREVIGRALDQLTSELDADRLTAIRKLAANNKLTAAAVLEILEGAPPADGH